MYDFIRFQSETRETHNPSSLYTLYDIVMTCGYFIIRSRMW